MLSGFGLHAWNWIPVVELVDLDVVIIP